METNNMKEYDRVKLIVEKENYARDGVHKGMVGWICDERIINEQRLVCFDEGEVSPFPIIPIKEKDLEVVWESHERQVGDTVILLSEKYSNVGFNKGLRGIIRDKKACNKWVILFDKQENLQQTAELTVDGNDFIVG